MRTRYVYFFKPVGMDGPIKIGFSDVPANRLAIIASWSPIPLEMLVTIPGSAALEHNLHDCFNDCHSHLEWFHPSPRLLACIEALKSGIPVEEAVDLTDRRGTARKGEGTKRKPWSEARRRYMTWTARLRQAEKVAGAAAGEETFMPERASELLASMGHGSSPSEEDIAFLESVVASPKNHCLTLHERWPSRSAA